MTLSNWKIMFRGVLVICYVTKRATLWKSLVMTWKDLLMIQVQEFRCLINCAPGIIRCTVGTYDWSSAFLGKACLKYAFKKLTMGKALEEMSLTTKLLIKNFKSLGKASNSKGPYFSIHYQTKFKKSQLHFKSELREHFN